MQSKTSFFNGTLFKKNIFRFWPLWAISSFIGFTIASSYFMTGIFSSDLNTSYMRSVLAIGAEMNSILAFIYALACAIIVWRYLFNTHYVGMMHSLPVSRNTLFITNYISGLAIMIIPYLVTGSLMALTSIVFDAFEFSVFLETGLICLGEIIFFFSLATLTCFLTGNIGVLIGVYFVINFVAAALELIIGTFGYGILLGYQTNFNGYFSFLSPVVKLISDIEMDYSYYSGCTEIVDASIVLWYALASIPIAFVALILYKKRSSESSGEPFTVGFAKTFFKYLIAASLGLVGGRLVYAIIFISENTARIHLIPLAICVVVLALIGYYGVTMIIRKTLKVFDLKSLLGALAIVAVVAVSALCLHFDVLGIEDYVPEASEVEKVSIFGDEYYSDLTDEEIIEKTVALHETLLEHKDELEKLDAEAPEYSSSYLNIEIEYTLKNGNQVAREYTYAKVDGQTTELSSAVDDLMKFCADQVSTDIIDSGSY